MSYILGSLGADTNALAAVAQRFSGQIGEVLKQAVKDNLPPYQAYNLFRFGRTDITSHRDPRLTQLMVRDRTTGEMTKATPLFKLWDGAIRGGLLAANLFVPPTNRQINTASYDLFKQVYNALIPPDEQGSADAAGVSETDYTPWIIGGVALVAVGVLVLRGQSMGPEKK